MGASMPPTAWRIISETQPTMMSCPARGMKTAVSAAAEPIKTFVSHSGSSRKTL